MKQKTYCSTITIYYTFYSVKTQCITDTSCTDSAQEFICGAGSNMLNADMLQ